MSARPLPDPRAVLAALCAEAGVDPALIPNAAPNGGLHPARKALSRFRTIRTQRSPDRQRSIERRRHLAASGVMPPALASRFTTSELAVLRIVGDQVKARGSCDLTLGEIAARAGVCRTTVQNALRQAAVGALITVRERRRRGANSLPNVVRIISREWLAWLTRGPRRAPPGFKMLNTTDREVRKRLTEDGVRAREVPSLGTAQHAARPPRRE
jgi:hypothetical protein